MRKKLFPTILLSVLFIFTGCAKTQGNNQKENIVDYSENFKGINGCAVFYDEGKNTVDYFNKEACQTRYSPYSTFKIISVLEGLKYGIVSDENSKMHYNGNEYPFETWNKDLGLKEAFQTSCVWYFKQLIDGVGEENMQNDLKKLNYGNMDVSRWEGSGTNPTEDTNGFWLGSSLQISPYEQTQVIADIFEGRTDYDKNDIALLKDVMKSEYDNIYGKTGTGRDNSAWYTGFYESKEERIYFALYLNNGDGESIAGANAKEIVADIISNNYITH